MSPIDQFSEVAHATDPIKWEPCDGACARIHGDRHRAYGQYGSRGSKLRRVVGVARALALRTGTLPAGAELHDFAAWASAHVDSADRMAAMLGDDLRIAVEVLA